MAGGNGRRRARGANFERKIKADLERMGYLVVRSARSLGAADLIAIAPGVVLLVQCKKQGYLAPDEWNELFRLAESVDAVAVVASASGYWELQDYKNGQGPQPWSQIEPGELTD